MASDVQQTPFVKQLAANDRPTRDAALLSLRTYLSNRHHSLTPLDLLKIWKGLFYSLWMCDRPRPQASLCADLASLLPLVPADTIVPFLRAFWQTMAREWTNIDVLRMEKFLLLVRRYVEAMFKIMRESGWEVTTVAEMLCVFQEVPLEATDARLSNGLRYHVIDIYVDELERVGALENDKEDVRVQELLEPLRKLERESPTKNIRRKCREALEDERLPGNEKKVEKKGSVAEEDDDDNDNDNDNEEWNGIED